MDENLIWIAREYQHHERDTGWYAGLFLFGIVLIAWALYTHNIITAILFGLIVFVVYILSLRTPDTVRVELTPRGIYVNDIFHPYSELNHFWIAYKPPHVTRINFEGKTLLGRYFSIELEEQDPDEVHEYLSQHLPESDEQEERFVDVIMRSLKL